MFDRTADEGRGDLFLHRQQPPPGHGGGGVAGSPPELPRLPGIQPRGYRRSLEERDAVVIEERNGGKVVLLSFTFGLNWSKASGGQGLPGELHAAERARARPFPPLPSKSGRLGEAGADAVVALLHWGLEFRVLPDPEPGGDGTVRLLELGIGTVVGRPSPPTSSLRERCRLGTRTHDGGTAGSAAHPLCPRGDLLSDPRGPCRVPVSRAWPGSGSRRGLSQGRPEARVTSLEVLPVYLHVGRRGREVVVDYLRILDFRKLAASLRTENGSVRPGKVEASPGSVPPGSPDAQDSRPGLAPPPAVRSEPA
ncbi:MAG: CapA family protein [Candidatus Moduliflexus flocculans]|nr:CapA family protein [Candidatus Moduliflexus flocculans]